MRRVPCLKDRWHDISQMSLFSCVTVQQQPLIRKKKKIFPPAEGAWPALKAVGEMLAKYRNRWQQQVWWARDDKGTECAVGKLSVTRVQELLLAEKSRDGGVGLEEQGRTDCHGRMTGTPWTGTNRERDKSGSGGRRPHVGWGASHHDGREARSPPADVRVTPSKHARRQPTRRSHRRGKKTKRMQP